MLSRVLPTSTHIHFFPILFMYPSVPPGCIGSSHESTVFMGRFCVSSGCSDMMNGCAIFAVVLRMSSR